MASAFLVAALGDEDVVSVRADQNAVIGAAGVDRAVRKPHRMADGAGASVLVEAMA